MFSRGGLDLGNEQGIFLYMGGGNHLEFGASRLRQLVRDFPDAIQADPARLALANEALRPTVPWPADPTRNAGGACHARVVGASSVQETTCTATSGALVLLADRA